MASYLLGNFMVALGVIMSVKSSLGVTPVQSIPFVISSITGVDQGLAIMGVYSLYVLLQAALLRKAFHVSGFLQFFIAVLFGSLVTICTKLVVFLPPADYFVRLLLMCLSVALIAAGLLFYLTAELIPQPAEGLVLAISRLTGVQVHNIKVMTDCAMVVTATLLSLTTAGEVMGVREGTLIAMIGIGKVLGLFLRLWQEKVRAFCFSE